MPPINPSPDPLTNKSSNLKKLFIVIGVVTFFGAIATGTFVYTSRNNNLDLSSADKAIALLSKTDKPPTQEEKDFTQAFGKILDSSNSKTGILEFNFMESRTNGQYFFYNIASSFWKATIKVECPRSVVARGRDGYGRFYDLADSKSPCSSDVEFISPNFGNDGINNGATNDVNNGSEIKVPGSTDAVQFFMVDKNTTKINLPTTLKVCDKSGKCLEKMTNIILPSSAQNSGASPSNSTGNVTPAIPKGVTTSFTANGVTKLSVDGNHKVEYVWTSSNADTFSGTKMISGCPDESLNETEKTYKTTASGSDSDTFPSRYTGCTFTNTYTAKNSKTGEEATSTIVIIVK